MGCYHFHLTQVKRSHGQSAVACAAYRSGEKLNSTYYGEINDYTRKGGVVLSEIYLPDHAPREFSDRETLWNAVEWEESNRKAQLAHSFDISLMNEFSTEENINMARLFVQEELVARGMIVDLAVHDPKRKEGEEPNPHIHIMVPIRPLNEDGTWGIKQKKIPVVDPEGNPVLDKNGKQAYRAVSTTDWSTKETLNALRKSWADRCNALYAEKGLSQRVDERSYENQGIGMIPTIHEGPAVRAMEAKGMQTALGNLNRMIRAFNDMAVQAKHLLSWIHEKVTVLREALEEANKPTLAGYLQEYYEERNRVAQTYTYGTLKAMTTNLKELTETIAFLQFMELDTPEQLSELIGSINSEMESYNGKIAEVNQTISKMSEFVKAWEDYKAMQPIYQEMTQKFLGKERFKKAHQKELNLYYRSRRIIDEYKNDEGKVNIGEGKDLLKKAREEKTELQEKKDQLNGQLKYLNKVQRSVDWVLNREESEEKQVEVKKVPDTPTKESIHAKLETKKEEISKQTQKKPKKRNHDMSL